MNLAELNNKIIGCPLSAGINSAAVLCRLKEVGVMPKELYIVPMLRVAAIFGYKLQPKKEIPIKDIEIDWDGMLAILISDRRTTGQGAAIVEALQRCTIPIPFRPAENELLRQEIRALRSHIKNHVKSDAPVFPSG